MKRKNLSRAVLLALVMVAGVEGTWLFGTETAAQTSKAEARSVPMFEVDPSWPKVPAKWKLGDVSSIAIDAQDNAWVLHRPRTLKADQAAMAAPPIIVFDPAGNFIKAWGGAGSGYEWVEREHGIHIDHKGFVWLGGNNCPGLKLPGLKPVADDQLLKFTQDGKFVLQIGASNQSKGNADTKNVHRAADVWVHPQTNERSWPTATAITVSIIFDADSGAFKRMWGAFANKPVDDDHCEDVPKPSFADAAGPQNFSIVHAIRVANDGMVYVADRENRRVQTFTNDGKFVKQLVKTDTPFARNLALSPDPEQQFLYVGNGKDIVDRRSQDARDRGDDPGSGHDRRRPSNRDRFEGQPLRRCDRQWDAEAHVQRDVVIGRPMIAGVVRMECPPNRHARHESPMSAKLDPGETFWDVQASPAYRQRYVVAALSFNYQFEHRPGIVLEDLFAIRRAQPLDALDHRFYIVHGTARCRIDGRPHARTLGAE